MHQASVAPVPPIAEAVLHFFENVGQRSEAEMYLRLFRAEPEGAFAAVVPSREVIRESSGTLAEQLAFLRQLGLFPSLLVGAHEPLSTEEQGWLLEALEYVELRPKFYHAEQADCLRQAQEAYRSQELPVILFERPSDQRLDELLVEMQPRKLLHLRAEGGIGPHGGSGVELSPGHFLLGHESGLAVINLRSDYDALLAGGYLSEPDVLLLSRCRQTLAKLSALESRAATISVVSPLSLLRELFTVRGEGTLIKLGSAISRLSGFHELDTLKLEGLLIESFGRHVREGFFDRAPLCIYLEDDYRGVLLLEPGQGAAYLSKFAVLPVARGEGLGQDLWRSLVKEHPKVYFRSRPDNPVNAWYASVCDGMQKTDRWNVYWRGLLPSEIERAVSDALARPVDLGPA